MPKVKVKKTFCLDGVECKLGSVVDVPDGSVHSIELNGWGEIAKDDPAPKQKPKAPKQQAQSQEK